MKKIFWLFGCAVICAVLLGVVGCTGTCPTCRSPIPANGVLSAAEQEATGLCCVRAVNEAELEVLRAQWAAERERMAAKEEYAITQAVDDEFIPVDSDTADPN